MLMHQLMHFPSLFPAYQEYWNPILMLFLSITGSVESVTEAREIFARPEASRSQDSEKNSWTSTRFTVKLPELGLGAGLGWHELPWVTSHVHRTSQDYCKANEIQLSLWWKAESWSAHPGLLHVLRQLPLLSSCTGTCNGMAKPGSTGALQDPEPFKANCPLGMSLSQGPKHTTEAGEMATGHSAAPSQSRLSVHSSNRCPGSQRKGFVAAGRACSQGQGLSLQRESLPPVFGPFGPSHTSPPPLSHTCSQAGCKFPFMKILPVQP